MDPATRNSHAKLLAADFLSLAVSPSAPYTFSRRGRPVARAESVGVIVSVHRTHKFLRFLLDDGSGCFPCVLWLNYHLLPQTSANAIAGKALDASAAREHAGKVRLGVLLRVRGRVAVFRGELQITVKDVVVERDPNAEILHWLQCMKLARDCYDVSLTAPPAVEQRA